MKNIIFTEQHWNIMYNYFVSLLQSSKNYTPYHTHYQDKFYESLGLGKEYCYIIEKQSFKGRDRDCEFYENLWSNFQHIFSKNSGHYPTYIKSLNESNINSLYS